MTNKQAIQKLADKLVELSKLTPEQREQRKKQHASVSPTRRSQHAQAIGEDED